MSPRQQIEPLARLEVGQAIPFGGDRIARVDEALAAAFRPGDRLVVVQETGSLLHIPADVHELVNQAVTGATSAFSQLAACSDDAISTFFGRFADLLADDDVFAGIATANDADVRDARQRGRSTTRLVLDAAMREGMIAGLRGWRDSTSRRDAALTRHVHEQWSVEARRAPLGVVGFVFEGRPNVFADACGVVRTGNAVVFRIGSDALGTARAIVALALRPALTDAGLPPGLVALVDSPLHAAGHALFADRRLALAVARGSGPAVAELGAVAAQVGTPVSLHGTGGAWMIAGEHADAATFALAVEHSLDRKVCNTLNVCAIPAARGADLVPSFLAAVDAAAARRGVASRLHVVAGSEHVVPAERFAAEVEVHRADGVHREPAASPVDESALAHEWEWEQSPEVTLVVTATVAEAVALCNRYSPRFVASLISEDAAEHAAFYAAVDAPFVGNGFTRWVDGQYALDAPELGLSNWQHGRMLGRGAILSGDSIHTVRFRSTVDDHTVHR